MNARLFDRLLRDPAAVAEDCKDDRELPRLVASALVAIVAGAVLFGAAVGSWHGGVQIAYAAAKLPLVTLATLTLCVPAFYAIAAVFGRPYPVRAAISLALAAGARFSLVLLAATPVVWLTVNLGAPYDTVKLVAALAYALAGAAALGLLVRGLGPGKGRLSTILAYVVVFLIVTGQSAWILRPYIGTPGRAEVTFFTTEREGGLAWQLLVSAGRVLGGGAR